MASKSYQKLIKLLDELGLDVNPAKNNPPSTEVTCLGIVVNTVNFSLSVPENKLSEIKNVCSSWKSKKKCSKKELQSLLGLLLYITKCVKHSRHFLNRMLDALKAASDADAIMLDQSFHRDLKWFNQFLTVFNGTTFFDYRKCDATFEIDACLEGLGGRFNNEVYHVPIKLGYKNYNICHLEMVNILVALKIWGQKFANKKLLIKCDNQACVAVINSGKTKDAVLAAMARNVQMLLAKYNIALTVIHVLGVNNTVADVLSRWSLVPDINTLLCHVQYPIWINLPNDILHVDWCI